MAEPSKTTLTPPYTTYKSFINLINDLRENGIPTHITRSVVKGSNSDKAMMNASLRALGLITDDATPTEKLKQLVEKQDNYSENLKAILHQAYPFLFDSSIDIANTTTEKVAEKFKDAGASGSTVSKGMSLFLALAKDAGIQVSSRVKAPAPVRSINGNKKKPKRSEAPNIDKEEGLDDDSLDSGAEKELEGMERITVSLRGMPDGVIYFPEGLNGETAIKAVRLAIFALKNYYDLEDGDLSGNSKKKADDEDL